MKYQVRLKYFEDDNGSWGFTHVETYDTANAFNAFWSAEGIAHDVLEHWFEGQIRYFSGKNICNVYGEMVASAMRIWMRSWGWFNIFKHRTGNSYLTHFEDTLYILQEYMENDYQNYPVDPIHIPYQRETNVYNLETVISEYWHVLCDKYGCKNLHSKNIRLSQIQNAYRYGYKLAERLYGAHSYSGTQERGKLSDFFNKFLDDWYGIVRCNNNPKVLFINDAEYGLKEIQFTVDTNKLKITTKLIDDVWNEHPLDALISLD